MYAKKVTILMKIISNKVDVSMGVILFAYNGSKNIITDMVMIGGGSFSVVHAPRY